MKNRETKAQPEGEKEQAAPNPDHENRELHLTIPIVEGASYPPTGDYTIRDTEIKGLGLRVSPGSKAWIVRRKVGGQSFRHTLGRFPEMTLAQARRAAKIAIGAFADGKHPTLERKARQESTKKEWLATKFTVADMWTRYRDQERKRPFSDNTLRDFKRLEKKMKADPLWPLPFASLTPKQVQDSFARMSVSTSARATNGGKTTGNLLFRMLRTAAQYAIDQDFPPETRNPFKFALKKSWNKSNARTRTLTMEPDSLKKWWEAVDALRQTAAGGDKRKRSAPLLADFQALVLLWGGRKTETLALEWRDINFTKKIVTFRITKSLEEHLFPLAPHAESILLGIKKMQHDWGWQSDFVFATTRTGHKSGQKTHIREPKKAIEKVAIAAGVPFSTHDIRRTFSNLLASADVGAEMTFVKMAMNHSLSGDVTASHYLNKVAQLRPHYERLEQVILKKVGAIAPKMVEIDSETFRKFQEFQAAELAQKLSAASTRKRLTASAQP